MLVMICLLVVTCTLVLCLNHSPHDVVDDVCASPSFEADRTVFAIVRGNVVISNDGGDSWRAISIGPYWATTILLSPEYERDSLVYVGCYGGGVLFSTNQGRSWQELGSGLGAFSVGSMATPSQGSFSLLACVSRENPFPVCSAGHSWEVLFQSHGSENAVRYLYLYGLDSRGWRLLHTEDAGFTCIGDAGGRVVLGTESGYLLEVSPEGATQRICHLQSSGGISCIHVPPGSKSIYAGTRLGGVFEITDDGKPLSLGNPGSAAVTSLGSVRRSTGTLLAAATWNEALYYRDIGSGPWYQRGVGLTTNRQADESGYRAPHFKGLSVAQADTQSTIFLGGFDGLFRATNNDSHWVELDVLPVGLIVGLDASRCGGDIMVTTYVGGAYRSDQDGSSWEVLNNGLVTMRLGAVEYATSTKEPETVFVGCESAVLRSTNGGRLWHRVLLKPPASGGGGRIRIYASLRRLERHLSELLGLNATRKLNSLFKRLSSGVGLSGNYFVFPTMIDVPARFEDHKNVFVGTREHGLFRSQDGGLSYTMILPSKSPIFSVASSPEFEQDGCVFVGMQGGVLRSTDSGENWKHLTGLSSIAPRLAISPQYGSDKTVFAASLDGLYRTRDGGDSWQPLSLSGAGVIFPIDGIALSPEFGSDGCMIVSARGIGPWRSFDQGDSFHLLATDNGPALHFSHLTGFPDFVSLLTFACDGTLYASTMYELFKSKDKGNSWESMPRPVRFEETQGVCYEGNWHVEHDVGYSSSAASVSASPGASALLRFHGSRIRWLGSRGPDQGIARVAIDDQEVATLDLYAPASERQCVLYESPKLEPGLRSIVVTVTGQSHSEASGARVCIDGFDVEPFARRTRVVVDLASSEQV